MASELPLKPGLYQQEAQVAIEGRTYVLDVRWSVREERFYLDVYDESREPVYTGIAVVLNFPLGVRCASSDFWPGILLAVDTTGENAEPTLADLGDRVRLVYYSAAEIA